MVFLLSAEDNLFLGVQGLQKYRRPCTGQIRNALILNILKIQVYKVCHIFAVLVQMEPVSHLESVPVANCGCRSPCRMSPERQHCPLAKLRSLRSLRPLPPSASSCQRRTRTRRAPPPARSGGGDVRYEAVCLRRQEMSVLPQLHFQL